MPGMVWRTCGMVLLCAGLASAQSAGATMPGSRVRVSLGDGPARASDVGMLIALGADSLVLTTCGTGSTRAYARAQITRLKMRIRMAVPAGNTSTEEARDSIGAERESGTKSCSVVLVAAAVIGLGREVGHVQGACPRCNSFALDATSARANVQRPGSSC